MPPEDKGVCASVADVPAEVALPAAAGGSPTAALLEASTSAAAHALGAIEFHGQTRKCFPQQIVGLSVWLDSSLCSQFTHHRAIQLGADTPATPYPPRGADQARVPEFPRPGARLPPMSAWHSPAHRPWAVPV
jgi:hypothetical protein